MCGMERAWQEILMPGDDVLNSVTMIVVNLYN